MAEHDRACRHRTPACFRRTLDAYLLQCAGCNLFCCLASRRVWVCCCRCRMFYRYLLARLARCATPGVALGPKTTILAESAGLAMCHSVCADSACIELRQIPEISLPGDLWRISLGPPAACMHHMHCQVHCCTSLHCAARYLWADILNMTKHPPSRTCVTLAENSFLTSLADMM